ncbi:uncharacterized membrane protein HdeD (DUF308 family) [Methanomicrobium sp. W14]|uniref:HdeD family acid-resistance protein n=1 Tax=Methanomicrobium sp. W14 TaxID=2817839 RepID=UPI001AE17905|nr:hypothetical protein [Methanomicrobium sp. W14]MBP2132691.1 uncharacterized membrane protein HdeD (DUF308 family) [Methanomicrobium sp. W14]
MPKLDDFLEPLNKGVWEVTVPKESVTEPLSKEWKNSSINVPSPGTIASYRNGQYHVHETEMEWKVHLDRHDPEKHPFLHLVDDAPLLLMIGDTFITLISSLKIKKTDTTNEILEKQSREWRLQVISGLFLILIGADIISDPIGVFAQITSVVIPLILIIFGVAVIIGGIFNLKKEKFLEGDVPGGIIIMSAGVIASFLTLKLWIFILTVVLSIWMFASAVFLLWRVRKGRSAVPEGFYSRMVIGIFSLVLVISVFYVPGSIISILMMTVGLIVTLIGIVLTVNGLHLKYIMKKNAKRQKYLREKK